MLGRGQPLAARRALWLGTPVTAALLAIAAVAGASHAVGMAPMGTDVALPNRLGGINEPGRPTIMIVGDSIPKEMEDAFGWGAKKRTLNLLPTAFGGCSVTGPFQLDDQTLTPFTWSARCSQVKSVQTQGVEKYRPRLVIWFSGREKFTFCTVPTKTGCASRDAIYRAGTSKHHTYMSKAINTSITRLTARNAKLVIVLPTPRGGELTGPCALDPTSDGCSADHKELASFAWLRRAYSTAAAKYPDKVAVVAMDDLLCPEFDAITGCTALTRVDPATGAEVLVRSDGVHVAESQERWFVSSLFRKIAALPGHYMPGA